MTEGAPSLSSAASPRGRSALLASFGRAILPGVIAGAVAGFLIGGVGGRLAMLLLRLTSGPEVIGLESDDGFTIGRISGDTFFLLTAVTVGTTIMLGPAYVLARGWVPPHWRVPVFATVLGGFGGGLLVQTHGIDFTLLSPRWLPIALFVAIPALVGAAFEPLTLWAARGTRRLPDRAALVIGAALPATPLVLSGAIEGFALLLGVGTVVALGYGEHLARAVRSSPVTWTGRVALAALFVLGSIDLARDVRALLFAQA